MLRDTRRHTLMISPELVFRYLRAHSDGGEDALFFTHKLTEPAHLSHSHGNTHNNMLQLRHTCVYGEFEAPVQLLLESVLSVFGSYLLDE